MKRRGKVESIRSDSRAVMHVGDICYLHLKARSADVIMKDNQEVSITHLSFSGKSFQMTTIKFV